VPSTFFFRNLKSDDPATAPMHHFRCGVVYFSAGLWWYSALHFGGSVQHVPLNNPDSAALKAWILAIFGDDAPTESDYRPGTAYKRIALPLNTSGTLRKATNSAAMTQSFVALKILLAKMHEVFETVEPSQSNRHVFGHRIRELLLLAAMEVEASWAAVLRANGYTGDRWNTKDYVKLLKPMLLDSFTLKLRSYPDFPPITPFMGWSGQSPTKSLPWYSAYNHTKHNREQYLPAATFECAVQAVSAAAVMFYAQFGYRFETGDEMRPVIGNVFALNIDHSMYPISCYIPNAENGPRAWEWELLNFPFA